MNTINLFDQHVEEYESWFEKYPYVFASEIEAVREMLPEGENLSGIEIGLGTGQYARALQIKEGIEPARNMRAKAIKRGIETMDAVAEQLPYADMRFDFVLMMFSVSYFKNLNAAFKEGHRVLKNYGSLVVGFIEKDSSIGKQYEAHKPESTFYKQAQFYSVDKIEDELSQAGFRHFTYRQTLFGELDNIEELQATKEGYGEGSFVVVRAFKKFPGAVSHKKSPKSQELSHKKQNQKKETIAYKLAIAPISTALFDSPEIQALEKLYLITEHWQSDLNFFEIEIKFLHKLILRYFMWLMEDDNLTKTKLIAKRLSTLEMQRKIHEKDISKHQKQYHKLLENPFSHDRHKFSDEHASLETDVAGFVSSFRAIKRETFELTEQVMETEKLKHLLSKKEN